jgi:hypothetical protein
VKWHLIVAGDEKGAETSITAALIVRQWATLAGKTFFTAAILNYLQQRRRRRQARMHPINDRAEI